MSYIAYDREDLGWLFGWNVFPRWRGGMFGSASRPVTKENNEHGCNFFEINSESEIFYVGPIIFF